MSIKKLDKTFSATPKDIQRKWYIVDATDLVLGRLSVVLADYLRGKHKAYYTPHMDCGDNIVVINADKIHLTGNKYDHKVYYKHSQYPGGLKTRTVKDVMSKFPERVIEAAVKNMVPKGPLGRAVVNKLFIYSGTEHPHAAQKPEKLDVAAMNPKNSKRN